MDKRVIAQNFPVHRSIDDAKKNKIYTRRKSFCDLNDKRCFGVEPSQLIIDEYTEFFYCNCLVHNLNMSMTFYNQEFNLSFSKKEQN